MIDNVYKMEWAVLGELEQLVMLAVARIGGEAYGVPVQREIERWSGRRLTLGTVHKSLTRLEAKGMLVSRTGDPTPVRGGRRKRHFALTPLGRRSLRAAVDVTRRMARGLDLGWEQR